MLIFDCSNSIERPQNRGFGGSVENACVKLIKKYSERFEFSFTDNPKKADLFFTNDIFPQNILCSKTPKVKRMDGVFWQNKLKERNILYNKSAESANCVIFVSEYSRKSYKCLYGNGLRKDYVALNWIDTKIFYSKPKTENIPYRFIAIATDWNREEKRGADLYKVAQLLSENSYLTIVGNNSNVISRHNIISTPYLKRDEVLAYLLRKHDILINLSYRDASPKVVAEAQSCGLPVLYANSGGTPELVRFGIPIVDKTHICFEEKTPELQIEDIQYSLSLLEGLKKPNFDFSVLEKSMITSYFNIFMETLNES